MRIRSSPGKRRSSFDSPPTHLSNDYSGSRALAVASTSKFKLPKGWRVKEVLRSDGSHSDKYYYEPGTGRQFRSLVSVQRHIRGEGYTPSRKRILPNRISSCQSYRYRRMIVANGKMLRFDGDIQDQTSLAIVASSRTSTTSCYNLPDGWVVEEVPRKYGNHTDKYFYEPGTGRKFRSQLAVQRYLAELNDERPLSETFEVLGENSPLSKMFKVCNRPKNPASFVIPPKRISWVISSPEGNMWNPFICDALIPDSVKNQWTKRFMLLMNE